MSYIILFDVRLCLGGVSLHPMHATMTKDSNADAKYPPPHSTVIIRMGL